MTDNFRDRIWTAATTLFMENGFKKTGMRDITEKSGVSVGTFYAHFSSKEELFLRIYLDLNQKELVRLSELIPVREKAGMQPVNILNRLTKEYILMSLGHPILSEFFNRPRFEKIFSKLTPEIDKEYMSFVTALLEDHFTRWQSEGKMKEISVGFFFSIVDSIALAISQKEYAGAESFDEIQEFLIDAVTDHLGV